MASLEVRIPFASTLNSELVAGTQNTNTEFGDIRITPRLLLYDNQYIHFGTGLGIYLPTARDTVVLGADGSTLVRVRNNAVLLDPYLGVMFTPNDRLFGQVWTVLDFDTNGSAVQVNATGQ